jgi:hypothetical protein
MTDDKSDDTTPAETPADAVIRKAKVGVIDKGEIVSTAFDEPMSGLIADITDGDPAHHKKR